MLPTIVSHAKSQSPSVNLFQISGRDLAKNHFDRNTTYHGARIKLIDISPHNHPCHAITFLPHKTSKIGGGLLRIEF